ncbi:Glycosyl transferases group 1 [Geodermatophilus siccatus]|uniref:Glycosyl transferases group 1 n=1 Tax=Geodermatophilus siccatus TaxID=1137991 RepID=A0A1G9RVK1_9ACTN|nr:glycosyltransferase [Geodermatophilus siccatus]SDM27289.1 Glycosyl transferases group 1 [Geodermatophilus siccatus]
MATGPVAPRRLLCVAPLVPTGGVDTLLTAFGMLAGDHPELSVEVLGTGPLSRVLHDQAAYLGIADRVHFRGRPTASAVRAAVHGCAVLVLPHRDDTGVAPTAEVALAQALASARPVVATPLASRPDLLDAGTVVPPGTPTVLAQTLESVLARSRSAADGACPADTAAPDRDGRLLRRVWLRVLR